MKHRILNTSILVFFFVFISKGLNLLGWNLIVPPATYRVFIIIAFGYYYYVSISSSLQHIPLSQFATFYLFWPLIPCFSTLLYGGDIFREMGLTLNWTFIAILFFVYTKGKFGESDIMRPISIIALITVLIQVIEQLNPEIAIFGVVDPTSENYEGDIASVRNGMYRLNVGCYTIQMLCLFYYWDKFINKGGIASFVMVFLMIISIYLYLTRQIIIAVIITFVLSIFLIKKRNQMFLIALVIIFMGGLLGIYWEELFGDFIARYEKNSYTTDIREECIIFTLSQFVNNPLGSFLGHGHLLIEEKWKNRGYYMSDIGFIGESFYYGLIWAFAYFLLLYKLLIANWRKIPLYAKSYLIASGIISIFMFPYRDRPEMFTWMCVLYLCSLQITNTTIPLKWTNRSLKILKYSLLRVVLRARRFEIVSSQSKQKDAYE